MSRRPAPAAIRRALPLSGGAERGPDPIRACNVCGRPSRQLALWREHDERDQPIAGNAALVYVGEDQGHDKCRQALTDHPRLYVETAGLPGTFPRLCGDCTLRRGFTCAHGDTKANGGPGLKVTLHDHGIICIRGPGGRNLAPIRAAIACVGRLVAGESRPSP